MNQSKIQDQIKWTNSEAVLLSLAWHRNLHQKWKYKGKTEQKMRWLLQCLLMGPEASAAETTNA